MFNRDVISIFSSKHWLLGFVTKTLAIRFQFGELKFQLLQDCKPEKIMIRATSRDSMLRGNWLIAISISFENSALRPHFCLDNYCWIQ